MVQRRVTGLWRHVSNVPEILGTLETCRHNPVTRNRPKLNHAETRFIGLSGQAAE